MDRTDCFAYYDDDFVKRETSVPGVYNNNKGHWSRFAIMDDSIPSISSGPVGSRFVSQDELDSARARRDEQWKAAYARSASMN